MDENANLSEVFGSEPSIHSVHSLKLVNTKDPTELEQIWMKVKDHEEYFDDLSFGRLDLWLMRMMVPSTRSFQIEDTGMVMLANILTPISAEVHFFTWKRPNPSVIYDVAKEIQRYAFEELKLQRLTGSIPAFNQEAKRLALMTGFRFEGTIRKTCLLRGKYHDVDIFGILKEEYEARKKKVM